MCVRMCEFSLSHSSIISAVSLIYSQRTWCMCVRACECVFGRTYLDEISLFIDIPFRCLRIIYVRIHLYTIERTAEK